MPHLLYTRAGGGITAVTPNAAHVANWISSLRLLVLEPA